MNITRTNNVLMYEYIMYLSCVLEWYMHSHQLVCCHHSMKGFVMQLVLDV